MATKGEPNSMTPQQFITKWGPGGPAFDLNERLLALNLERSA